MSVDREAWTEAAAHWREQADRIAAMTRPVTAALVERLGPEPGHAVLDVASGVGDPALRLARLVSPGGSVVATDAVPDMLATLRERAATAGLANLATVEGAAEALAFDPDSFDRASCRFGAMFFEDPERALGNLRAPLRAGGRAVLAVWGRRESNPFFTLTPPVLDACGVPEDAAPDDRKTPFEWSEPGALATAAARAGFADVEEHVLEFDLVVPGVDADGFLDFLREMSRATRSRTEGLDEGALAAPRAALAEAARPYERAGRLAFPAEAFLVVGRA